MSDLQSILNEDNPLVPTKESSKQGWLFLAAVLIGCTICVPVFFMGAQLAHQASYPDFITGAFLGGLLACVIASATGVVGQKTGLPSAMLAKISFGRHGYILANLAMVIGAIGWFGIQTNIFSDSFVKMSAQVWGINFSPLWVTIVAGLIMSTTAIIGFRGLGKLSYIATPLLIFILALPLYQFFQEGKLSNITSNGDAITMGTMIAIVAGAYSFACTMPDLTRFMRSASATVKGMIANFIFAYPLVLIATGTLALVSQENDFMQIMLGLGIGSVAILALFLSTWTTNDTNAYVGALAVNLFLPKLQRWKIAAIVGALGTLAAVFGIFEHFMSWLILTGNLFAPMAGVYVADFWLNQKRYKDLDNIPKYRIPQILAWLGGLSVGMMTTPSANMGFELFNLTTVPMIDAIIVAAIIQVGFVKLSR